MNPETLQSQKPAKENQMSSGYGLNQTTQFRYPQETTSPGASVGYATDLPKESPLSEQLNGLVSGIAEVEQNLSILENRLAPVMMPPVPVGQTNGVGAPTTSSGAVVDAIRESNRRLASVSAHVRYLIDKLAV